MRLYSAVREVDLIVINSSTSKEFLQDRMKEEGFSGIDYFIVSSKVRYENT